MGEFLHHSLGLRRRNGRGKVSSPGQAYGAGRAVLKVEEVTLNDCYPIFGLSLPFGDLDVRVSCVGLCHLGSFREEHLADHIGKASHNRRAVGIELAGEIHIIGSG